MGSAECFYFLCVAWSGYVVMELTTETSQASNIWQSFCLCLSNSGMRLQPNTLSCWVGYMSACLSFFFLSVSPHLST